MALLEAGMISVRAGGGGSAGEGEQRRVGWLQALELPEYAERLRCCKTTNKHAISNKPGVSY